MSSNIELSDTENVDDFLKTDTLVEKHQETISPSNTDASNGNSSTETAVEKKLEIIPPSSPSKPVKLKLNTEEREEYSEVFDLLTGDSSNISRKEIGLVMRKLGQNPSDAELDAMINEVDLDGYGAINKKNFMTLVTKKLKGSSTGGVDVNEESFQAFDQSNSGRLMAADIRKIMTNIGEKLCDEEVEEMLAAVNADNSGISYESFLQLVST